MQIFKQKKPLLKDYIYYNFKYITFWIRQNYGDSKRSVIIGNRRWEGYIGRTKDFSDSDVTLHDTIMVDASLYICQNHRMCNTKREP